MSKNPNEYKNKQVRTLMYQKLKKEKNKIKKKSKQENKDKPKQVPKTIENCRIIDDTFIKDIQNDPELQLDLNTDEISKHFARGKNKKNKKVEEEEKEESDEDEEVTKKNKKAPRIVMKMSRKKIKNTNSQTRLRT